MGRIIGIGGIFFKCKDEKKTKLWYQEAFGIKTDDWGAPFAQLKVNAPTELSFLQWSPMPADTSYFFNDDQQFMINYRVENIEEIVKEFQEKGFEILDQIESYDYGKFVHLRDLDGRAIELWEPIDKVFTEMYDDLNKINHE